MLTHTGSDIVSDDAGVVVGLVASEAFQHPPHLTRSFRLWYRKLPDSSFHLCCQTRHLLIQTHVCFGVSASASMDLLSLLHVVVDLFRHPTPYCHSHRFLPNVFLGCLCMIALMRVCISPTSIFLFSLSCSIWLSTFLVKTGRLPFFQSQTSRFCPFSCSAGRMRVMVIGWCS